LYAQAPRAPSPASAGVKNQTRGEKKKNSLVSVFFSVKWEYSFPPFARTLVFNLVCGASVRGQRGQRRGLWRRLSSVEQACACVFVIYGNAECKASLCSLSLYQKDRKNGRRILAGTWQEKCHHYEACTFMRARRIVRVWVGEEIFEKKIDNTALFPCEPRRKAPTRGALDSPRAARSIYARG
jgi:hypothetical protein